MKILFVWPGLTGYMGDCWRALAKRAQVKVLVDGTGLGKNFTEDVMSGIDWTRVTEDNVIGEIRTFAPDAVVVVGWHRKLPRKVAFAKELDSVAKFLVMDMPWRWSVKCLAARFVLRRYLRRFRGILVHGEPSARYARWLGFAPEQIHRHCICGVNLQTFKPSNFQTLKLSNFLFVGRKVKEKGIETLKKAYEIYRQEGGKWTLTMPEWIDPKDVPGMMREHACLVLPSLWEPWGVVVAEAKAAGDWNLKRVSIGLFRGVKEDEWFINTSRIMGVNSTDPESWSDAESEGRRQVQQIFAFFKKYVPGCADARLLCTGSTVGVRESRHIYGEYRLTVDDCLHGRRPPDTILCAANSVDIHGRFGPMSNQYVTVQDGDYYGVPYRCLVPLKVENLLVAGRCLSATSEAAGAVRVMPPVMAMGQAAGTAAALCIRTALVAIVS